MMRIVPTNRKCGVAAETDFLAEYKGASGMFYAKTNTSRQRSLELGKYDDGTSTNLHADGGSIDSRSQTPFDDDHQSHETRKNPLLSKALHELDQSLIEGDRQRMAQSWNSLGLVRLHTQLDPHEAIRCHRNALQLLLASSTTSTEEDSGGPPSIAPYSIDASCSQHALELATTYKDLGLCYERLNDTTEAMTMYLEAQRIVSTEKLLVESHPQMLALNRAIDRIQRIL